MRDLRPRSAAPAPLSDAQVAQRREWYAHLTRPGGRIHDRWGRDEVRAALAVLSDGCCAWCGALLNSGWPVDHYLPKERFPELAYCWENLLPSCTACNTVRKRGYSPPGLNDRSLIDPALSESEGRAHYKPDTLLATLSPRLVEPTVEDPAVHLKFEPVKAGYTQLSPIGDTTRRTLFHEAEKDFATRMAGLSADVEWRVKNARSPDALREGLMVLIRLVGSRVYVEAYARMWLALLRPDWGAAPVP